MGKEYDFSGYATRNDLLCSDGRVIRSNAFKDQDGGNVPLVWNHDHQNPENVIGHAMLENRADGVYAYGKFNESPQGQHVKHLVDNGDITSLSIWANQLKQNGRDVVHGTIREVSLVLAGANPGAFIDAVIAHSDSDEFEAVIYSGQSLHLSHSDEPEEEEEPEEIEVEVEDDSDEQEEQEESEEEKEVAKELQHADEETIGEIIATMNEKQKNVLYGLVGKALEANGSKEENEMKQNAFEGALENDENVISHSDMQEILSDGKRMGSLKEAFLQHGIENIDYLFPDAKNLTNAPGFINTNPIAWVETIMRGVHHTPFSRIKMMFADITQDQARAKGYIKGNYKIEETFSLLKRTVTPCTVYKKQKLDRDDVIDITDFDVVAWLKAEMRMKLDEELARAYIFGDGRLVSDDDKISETNIIPVVKDTTNNLYAMESEVTVSAGETEGHAIINAMVKAMDNYEGSGNITAFIKQTKVSDMMLLEDGMGHRMYKSLGELAAAMGVNQIVKVPASIVPSGVLAVALDLRDYNVGADKGGAVNMFDDFDIDYNAQKYLIETRCSGALTLPHSAIVLKEAAD